MITRVQALALAFVLAALLCIWQRATIADLRAEIAGIETAFARAQVNTLTASLEATNAVFTERDQVYAGIKEASVHAVTQIAAALPEDGKADIDRAMPRSVSDPLLLQHAGIHPGCGVDSPSGSSVCPQAPTGTPSAFGPGHDRATDGALAQ